MDQKSDATGTGTYLYAVMPDGAAPKSFRAPPVGSGSKNVRLVREGDLVAVVSDAPLTEFDPTRANLMSHERVVEEALQTGEVLPVRFGTVAENDGEITQFLRDKHDDLVQSLEHLRGRVEVGLKVLWDHDRILAELLEEDEEIRAMRDAIANQPEAQTYDQRLELGKLVTEALEEKRKAEAEQLLGRLQPLTVDVAVNRLLAEDMILNAGFLVENKSLEEFDKEVNAIGTEQNGRFSLKYVGPLAPYDFVSIIVRKPKAA